MSRLDEIEERLDQIKRAKASIERSIFENRIILMYLQTGGQVFPLSEEYIQKIIDDGKSQNKNGNLDRALSDLTEVLNGLAKYSLSAEDMKNIGESLTIAKRTRGYLMSDTHREHSDRPDNAAAVDNIRGNISGYAAQLQRLEAEHKILMEERAPLLPASKSGEKPSASKSSKF